MKRYKWAASGDVNAFFGLMLDNIADLVLTVTILVQAFQFDASFVVEKMIPGTALGVVVGDLLFTFMAFRLAKRTGRQDVTAMPLGLDTPSTLGMVLFVVGPAFLDAKARGMVPSAAADHAWKIGMACIVISGIFKLVCALGSAWIRRVFPRAALLGSLAAIALVLISFLPLLDIVESPVAGFLALAVVLTTMTAHIALPARVPGALAAVVVGTVVYYAMSFTGTLGHDTPQTGPLPGLGLLVPWPSLAWWPVLSDTLPYLPIAIPFALATVVGGIDCTESAAAAGDEYPTGQIIAAEGIATLVAGLCGGIVQTTPYIGHPAYRAMGGRAAYTLATALFVGGAGMFGYFAHLYAVLPKVAVLPILIFVGLEITSQSFQATPRRHYPAVALACVPALAYLVLIFVDRVMAAAGTSAAALPPDLSVQLQTLRVLAGGFLVTGLLWAAALAATIDRQLRRAAWVWFAAAGCCAFGIIHSPLPGHPMFWPWSLPPLPESAAGQSPYYLVSAYLGVGALLWFWAPLVDRKQTGPFSPEVAEGTADDTRK